MLVSILVVLIVGILAEFNSAFNPVEGMPKVVRIFAEDQPMIPIIQTIRNLLDSQAVRNDLWLSSRLDGVNNIDFIYFWIEGL